MTVIVVANPKGGVGKSTLATHVAGYLTRCGHSVMLGDADRQQSSGRWLGLRPPQARPIATWDASASEVLKPPRGTTHVVIDTPAGVHGRVLKALLKRADKLLIPVQPSIFDIFATQDFFNELAERKRTERLEVAVVGMRVDSRTRAAEQLRSFLEGVDLPVLACLRETQTYLHLAAQGLTLFDVVPSQVARDLEQWAPICRWLER